MKDALWHVLYLSLPLVSCVFMYLTGYTTLNYHKWWHPPTPRHPQFIQSHSAQRTISLGFKRQLPKPQNQRTSPRFRLLLPPVLPMGSHEQPDLRYQPEGHGIDRLKRRAWPYARPCWGWPCLSRQALYLCIICGGWWWGQVLGWLEKNTNHPNHRIL